MNTKTNLKASLANPRSRIFLFLMIGVIVMVSLIAYTSRNRNIQEQKDDAGISANSSVINPGAAIDSTPGITETSAEYQELQKKKYQEITNKALGDTGMPVAALPSLSTGAENLSAIPGLQGPKDPTLDPNVQIKQQINAQQQAQLDLQAKQNDTIARQKEDAANQNAQALMSRQISLLARNWQVIPQQFVPGVPRVYTSNITNETVITAEGEAAKKPKIYYKAGDILFGVLLTSVNSDQPGPILARVISGPLNGSKIIGTINQATIPLTANAPKVSRSLILEFNLMNIPGKRVSVPITAVAIDPQTANTGLATSVDNHYMLRYGTFFAANFISGLGQAIQSQSQAKIITSSGTADIGRTTGLDAKDETKVALGKTAEAFTKTLNFIDTPPTIRIASGTAVGILLQNDIVIQDDNTQQLITQSRSQITYPQQYQQQQYSSNITNVNNALNGTGGAVIGP